MSRTYYKTCPHCGAHLDPGEVCDCRQEPSAEEYKALIVKLLAKMDDRRMLRILYQRVNTLLTSGDCEPIDPATVRNYLKHREEKAS